MAELVAASILSSFFDVIFKKLLSVDLVDYFRRGKLKKLRKKLESTLNSINEVLDDAEEKQYKSEKVKEWLGDVKHFAYEVDQLLDEMATDARRKKLMSILSIPIIFVPRFKKLLEKLVPLVEQKDELRLEPRTCARIRDELNPKPSEGLPTVSLVEPDIYGREGDKKEVINLLLSEWNDNGNQVPVISIVGLGGMGKTTLAKLVYNDDEIKKKFEHRAWVYVSESYDVVGLTKAILRSFQFSAEGGDWDLLQQQLHQKLTGKKYLLVLDDVWNANWNTWEQLLLPFNHGSSGSKIIVTTRDKEVASIMKSTWLHHLKELEESSCWSLFEKHAFSNENVSHDLVSIGKKIVVKCGGLPLAIKALANLLKKFSPSEWAKILDSDMWGLLECDRNINPVLRLSYHNLPSNLKRCFAYCSIFPKVHWFDKGEIINLWMADGLLKCSGVEKSEEELGGEIFRDLESISFFQKEMVWYSNSSYPFVMHDLVNDLAKSVSGELCLRLEDDRMKYIPERTRYIFCSIDLKDGERKLDHVYKIKGLRSLIVKEQGMGDQRFKICNNVQHGLFSSLKHLRMLSFSGCLLLELADEISNLQLLRYLDLSDTGITSLPNSICKLYNLETLLLTSCELAKLPSDFCYLVNLRHLDLEGTLIEKMPKNIGRLNNLQTLAYFVVGKQSGSELTVEGLGFGCPKLDLGSRSSTQYLTIIGWRSGLLFALHSFGNLKELRLYDCPQLASFPQGGLHPNLNTLELCNCPKLIASREEWGLFQLNSLQYFRVIDEFGNMESFPEENLLPPNLNSLYLEDCSKLRVINYKGLPKSLKSLSIEFCPCLERLPEEGLPNSLSTLFIYGCSLLKQLYQKKGGERWQTISHIHQVIIDMNSQN